MTWRKHVLLLLPNWRPGPERYVRCVPNAQVCCTVPRGPYMRTCSDLMLGLCRPRTPSGRESPVTRPRQGWLSNRPIKASPPNMNVVLSVHTVLLVHVTAGGTLSQGTSPASNRLCHHGMELRAMAPYHGVHRTRSRQDLEPVCMLRNINACCTSSAQWS